MYELEDMPREEGQPEPDIIAHLDQVQATMRSISMLVNSYMIDLMEQGMPQDKAFILARDYQNILIQNNLI